MTTMQELDQRIVQRRTQLGISQHDVAFTVGVNRRVIGEIERGKETVRADILIRTLESLGLDIRLDPRS